MAFTDDDDNFAEFDDVEESTSEEQPANNNRLFIILAIVLGILFLIGLVCVGVMAFNGIQRGNNIAGERAAQSTQIAATNQAIVQAVTETAIVLAWTPTPSNTPTPTLTPTTTPTQVVVQPSSTPAPTDAGGGSGGSGGGSDATPSDPRTATVAALLTQAAGTSVPLTPAATALPDTGFVDDIGLPGLLGAALLLLVIIIVVRRLRTSA